MTTARLFLSVAFFCAVVGGGVLRGQVFTRLGQLPDWQEFQLSGISNTGVAVGSGLSPDGVGQAIRWSREDGVVGLGFLPGGDHGFSSGSDISADGNVIVGVSTTADKIESFRWTAGGGMIGLGSLPEGPPVGPRIVNPSTSAYAVSADGNTAVGLSNLQSGSQAFRWAGDTGLEGLGPFFKEATGTSGDGSVIVGVGYSPAGHEAVRWTREEGPVGLGFLPGGTPRSYASAISADGGTIVGYGEPNVEAIEAFRWTASGGMMGLGILYEGGSSWADAVSGDGSIILGSSWPQLDSDAAEEFVWTPGAGMRRLVDMLAEEYGLGSKIEGWHFSGASISPNGRYIVGQALNPDGEREAWLVDLKFKPVPEPSTYGMYAAALLGFIVWRRRLGRNALALRAGHWLTRRGRSP